MTEKGTCSHWEKAASSVVFCLKPFGQNVPHTHLFLRLLYWAGANQQKGMRCPEVQTATRGLLPWEGLWRVREAQPSENGNLNSSPSLTQGLFEVYCPGKGALCQLPLTRAPACPCATGGSEEGRPFSRRRSPALCSEAGAPHFPAPPHRSNLWGLQVARGAKAASELLLGHI